MTFRCPPHIPAKRPDIMIVAETPSEADVSNGEPFSDYLGQLLDTGLQHADIDRSKCYITHVFPWVPSGGTVESLCGLKADMPKPYNEPQLKASRWVFLKHINDVEPEDYEGLIARSQVWTDGEEVSEALLRTPTTVIERLALEIQLVQPKVILTLGNCAIWAVLRRTGIMKVRGSVQACEIAQGYKVLPTFHPKMVKARWENRIPFFSDIDKLSREAHTKAIQLVPKSLRILPDLQDLEDFWNSHLRDAALISFDIETQAGFITCIGFASNAEHAIVVPFYDRDSPTGAYWSDAESETAAWVWVAKVLSSDVPKLAQNGLYDLQYLARVVGIPVNAYTEDTMLLHHTLWPELPKGLGAIATLHTDNPSWKHMRSKLGDDPEKLLEGDTT